MVASSSFQLYSMKMKNYNRNNRKAFTLAELLITMIILFTFFAMIFLAVGGCRRILGATSSGNVYSSGFRDGVVTKFSYKGGLSKTYEGELVMGGIRTGVNSEGTRTSTANVWAFTVDATEKQIIETLSNLSPGQSVRLKYVEYAFSNPLGGDTSYRVTNVTVIK